MAQLPRHGVKSDDQKLPLGDRFAEITLSARVTIAERAFQHVDKLSTWHPLGGERRLVHWQRDDSVAVWKCPETVKSALQDANRIRMVLATPAIFEHGWRPGWLDGTTLIGKPMGDGPTLKLVGVCIARWRAGLWLGLCAARRGRTAAAASFPGIDLAQRQFAEWCRPAAFTSSRKSMAICASWPQWLAKAGERRTTRLSRRLRTNPLGNLVGKSTSRELIMTGTRIYWLHTLSPTHVGIGRGVGYIDLPIDRDGVTGWPIIRGSAFKGVWRDWASNRTWRTSSRHSVAPIGRRTSELLGP